MFYAWHWYGQPSSPDDAVKNVQAISEKWNMPSFATEFMGCSRTSFTPRLKRALVSFAGAAPSHGMPIYHDP